jgi:hypothetical protein
VRVIGSDTLSNTITSVRKRIYDNAGLGIDLGSDGPPPNDPRDLDSGPNGLQNKPAIGSALTSAGKMTIRGTLRSTPNETFAILFFSNPAGTNEGKIFIGQRTVTTGAGGKASFKFSPTAPVRPARRRLLTVPERLGEALYQAALRANPRA